MAAAGEVRNIVRRALAGGRRALVLGGDCTVELGVVAAAAPAGLVYFDMHPDLNTAETARPAARSWMGVAHMLSLPGTHPENDLAAVARIAPDDIVLLAADATQMTEAERHGPAPRPDGGSGGGPAAAARRALAARGTSGCSCTSTSTSSTSSDLPLSENTGHNIGLSFAAARAVLDVLLADPPDGADRHQHNPLHGAADGSTSAALAEALAAVACA